MTNNEITNLILVIFIMFFVGLLLEIIFRLLYKPVYEPEHENKEPKPVKIKTCPAEGYEKDFHFERNPYINTTSDLNYDFEVEE